MRSHSLAATALLSAVNANPFLMTRNVEANATSQAGVNPFAGMTMYANPFYAKRVEAALPNLKNPSMASKASAVGKIPSFYWMDSIDSVPALSEFVAAARGSSTIMPIVVYNLPNRDCAASASNGELSLDQGGAEKYKTYINAIKQQIADAPNQKFVIVYEPDSLANLVTNMNTPKCQQSAAAYRELTAFGLKALDLPNVHIYLDAGHAGWLGWPANLDPAAKVFIEVYKSAGSPKAVRGLATNVANYNAWKFPGGGCPSIAESNKVCDESRYVNALGPKLQAGGFPAKFIIDTSRNGVQPTKQQKWGNWCNLIGTGFGLRPTSETGDPLVDAFVWVKPGGECDGTSDNSAARFDPHCASSDALQPAPEAGEWFQEYFEQLLTNANPPIAG